VFNSVANVPADSVKSRMLGGRLFQIRGPATANDLSPSAVLVRGTTSIEVSADLVPGRRVPAWWQYSARYDDARPVRHLWISVASLPQSIWVNYYNITLHEGLKVGGDHRRRLLIMSAGAACRGDASQAPKDVGN